MGLPRWYAVVSRHDWNWGVLGPLGEFFLPIYEEPKRRDPFGGGCPGRFECIFSAFPDGFFSPRFLSYQCKPDAFFSHFFTFFSHFFRIFCAFSRGKCKKNAAGLTTARPLGGRPQKLKNAEKRRRKCSIKCEACDIKMRQKCRRNPI